MLLSEEDLKDLTALNEQDQQNSETAVKRPQLTNNALKKRLQIVDDVNHFFQAAHLQTYVHQI
jgi:hypothetical protein